MVASDASVRVMSRMMISGDVQGLQLHLWLSSLGLLQVVTENMLSEAKALLDLSSLAAEAALPVSSMVSAFCRRHLDCGGHTSVSRIMLALKKNIGVACEADKMSQGKIVRTLHAIGNSGQAAQVEDVLDNCIRRKYFPEVRIAALQALYYMPCIVNRTRAEGIFHDHTEDWEVRITSYLAIMQCASPELLSNVRRTMAAEQNEQVLSFVKCHVTNLRKKARSRGDHVPKFLDHAEFSSWEKDEEKFQTAKNIYASFFSDRHSVGVQIDANVLWPSSSPLAFDLFTAASSNTSVAWLPRSSALKVAVDAFGEKWNLFEAGLRAEGLEPVIENIILSSFPAIRSSPRKPVRGETGDGSLYVRFLGKEIAFFRSEGLTPGQGTWLGGQTFMSALKTLSTEGGYNFTQSAILTDVSLVVPTASGLPLSLGLNTSASVELAIFGKLDFHDLTSNPRNVHVAGQIRASGILSVTGTMAVDAMGTGVGVRMSATARASSSLGGHVILERGQEVRVELDMPQDQIDILDFRSEFSVIHNSVQRKLVPTSPGSKVRRHCTGPYAARVTGLELCGHVELPWSPEGLNPYGPATLSVTLHKRDTHTRYSFIAKHVQKTQSIATLLEIKTPGSKVDRTLGFDLLVDVADLKDVRLHLGFASPWKSAKVTGSVTNSPVLKSAICSLIVDEAAIYTITMEVRVVRAKFDVTYLPVLQVRRPGSPDWLLKGVVSVRVHWKVLTAEVLAQGLTQYPLILKTSITNTNLEKSIKVTAVHGAGMTYTFAAGTSLAFIGKGAYRVDVNYFLVFTTPTRELLTLSGSGGYRPGHIFKTDLKMTIDKYKPLLAECLITKMKRRSDLLLYSLDVNIKSAVALLKVDSAVDVKKDRMVSARVTVTHDIPSVLPRDKMTVGFKATANSNFVVKSCYITLNMDSLAIPDYSFSAKLLGEHRMKQTEAEMVINHGQDRRDPKNQILFSTKVKHDVLDKTTANLGYKILVSAPRKDIDIHLKGHHIHTTRSVDSACELTFGTNQSARAHLMFKDRSSRLLKMSGEAQIEAPVLDVMMKTTVFQKNPKHFVHSVSLTEGKERRHSIMTVFRESDKRSFAILSDVLIHGWQNIRLTCDTRLQLTDLKVGSSIFYGEKKYGASVASAVKASKHKLTASLYYTRELYSLITHTEQRLDGIYSGTLKVAWEGENRVQRPLLVVRGLLHTNHKAGGDIRRVKLSAQSPAMRGFMTVDNETPQLFVRGKIFRGRKKSSYSTTLELKKPVSLGNVQFLCKILTPDRHCHRTEIEVVHTLHPMVAHPLEHLVERGLSRLTRGWLPPPKEASLSGPLQGGSHRALNQHTAEGEHTQQWWHHVHEQDTVPTKRADIQGGITVKSTVENPIDVRLDFMHKQDGHLHEQTFKLDGRSNNDTIALIFSNKVHHFHIRSVGELDLKSQARVVFTEWNLENTGGSILSNFSSSWSPDGKVHFKICGHRDITRQNELIADVILQTPWKPIRDWTVSLVLVQSSESFLSESSLRESDVEIVSHRIYALFTPSLIDANLTVLTPWTTQLVGALHGRYNATAMTGAVEVRWTPRDRIAADGQVTLVAWNDLSAFLSVDTPFPGARVVVYEISNKNTQHGLSSFLILRFGFGKTYGIETLLRKNPVNIRVKLQSPYENFRVFETGIQMTGSVMKMKAGADFRLYPLIGKYECLVEWECASDPNISGKLRLSTPLKMLHATEISMRLKYVDDMHISRLTVQFLPAPPFTVDAELSLGLPFLASVEAKTPLEGFKKFNTTIKHQVNHSLTTTYLEIYYPPYQMFETKAVIDWNDTANRGALLRDALTRFEDRNLLFWNKGSLQEFAARGKLVLSGNLTSFFSRQNSKTPRMSEMTSTDIQQTNKTLQFLSHVTPGQVPAFEADVSCIVSQNLTEMTWTILYKNSKNGDSAAVLRRKDVHARSFFLVSLRRGLEFLGSTNVTVSEGVLRLSQSLTAHFRDNIFNESLVFSRDENVTSCVGLAEMRSLSLRGHRRLADRTQDKDVRCRFQKCYREHYPDFSESNNNYTEMIPGEALVNLNAELQCESSEKCVDVKPKRNRQLNEVHNVNERTENGETFVKLNGRNHEQNSSWVLSVQNSEDDQNANVRVTRKFVRPDQNVIASFTLIKTALAMMSEGQLTYGDIIPTDRLFYSLQQNISESQCCQNTNMRLMFGRANRSFEIDGVWSDSRTSNRLQDEADKSGRQYTKALRASLSWDADKDRNKCLTFHSILGTGGGTTLDVTLASPVTDQEIRLKSILKRDDNCSWTATTSFSYSSDPRKDVTLVIRFSRPPLPPHLNNKENLLLNKKESTQKILNYTAFLRVEHPFSDLDLGLTTRVSGEETGFKGGVELWYMTTLRQRKYVSVQSSINNTDREVQVQVRTPGLSWTARANLSSSFHLTLSAGRHDGMQANVATSEMTIDRHQRTMILTVACDSELPDNVLVLEGKYINDSTINVVLSHHQVTEGLLSIRLNTSTLLHTHVYWRPESITAFKEMTISSLINAELHLRHALKEVSQAVRNELTSRYSRYGSLTNASLYDVIPLLPLLRQDLNLFQDGEDLLSRAGRHLDQLLYTLHAYIFQEQLQLRALRVVDSVKGRAREGARTLHNLLVRLDQHLQEGSQRMASRFLKNFNDEDKRMNCSGSPNYKTFQWTVTSKVKSALSKIASAVSALKLYYQVKGTWLEDNLKIFQSMGSSLSSMALTLKQIVSSEVAHGMRHFRCPRPTRITVWLPQDGEVQAEMCLPVPLQSLDTSPDVADYVTSVFSAVLSYYTQSRAARETLVTEEHDAGGAPNDEC